MYTFSSVPLLLACIAHYNSSHTVGQWRGQLLALCNNYITITFRIVQLYYHYHYPIIFLYQLPLPLPFKLQTTLPLPLPLPPMLQTALQLPLPLSLLQLLILNCKVKSKATCI